MGEYGDGMRGISCTATGGAASATGGMGYGGVQHLVMPQSPSPKPPTAAQMTVWMHQRPTL